jgi:hypothetical protein
VQAGHPVGDVRRRQKRREPVTEVDSEHRFDGVTLEQQVGVGHLHTLGVSGSPGCVDESDDVVGLHRPPCRLEVESSGAAAYRSSAEIVPAGEPSMQTMCSMGVPLDFSGEATSSIGGHRVRSDYAVRARY